MTDRNYYLVAALITAIAIGAATQITRVDDSLRLRLDMTEKAIGHLVPDQVVKVSFRVHNRSSRPIRVVGATMTCQRTGCLSLDAIDRLPMTIPPGEDGLLDSTFKAGDSGDFSHPMTVFTDCYQSPKIVLRVTGRVADPRGAGYM